MSLVNKFLKADVERIIRDFMACCFLGGFGITTLSPPVNAPTGNQPKWLGNFTTGEIWHWDGISWVGFTSGGGGSISLHADQPTQDSANLVADVLQLVPAGLTTYGVVKLEDLVTEVTFPRVANYAALPAAASATDEYYHVEASQGTSWLPGGLGGTYYSKGFYYSDGAAWVFVGEVPYQATQGDVNAGVITDQFVSPATLANASTVAHPSDLLAYLLLAGRSGGQVAYGGINANDDLVLEGTSHATKASSYILMQRTGGAVGIGTISDFGSGSHSYLLSVAGNVKADRIYCSTFRDATSTNTWFLLSGSSPNQTIVMGNAGVLSLEIITKAGGSVFYNNVGGKFGIGNNSPQQTLHVTGTARITGSDGVAIAPMGRDADGDVSAMTEGYGINFNAGAIEVDSSILPTGGTYTPTNSNNNGLDGGPTMHQCMYTRVGNFVTINGSFQAASDGNPIILNRVGLSLPIASDFTNALDARGQMTTDSQIYGVCGAVRADVTNNIILVTWYTDSASSIEHFFQCTYEIK